MARGLPSNKYYIIHFSRAKSPLAFFSKFIQWVEKRPYSHVSIEIVEPATQLPLIFQASKGLVNFFYKPAFLDHNQVVYSYEVQVTSLEHLSIWNYAVRKMGSDYGWKELLSIGFSKLFHVKGWFADGEKTNICSELAARVCVQSKLPMPESLDDLTPSDFHKIIEAIEARGLVRKVSNV